MRSKFLSTMSDLLEIIYVKPTNQKTTKIDTFCWESAAELLKKQHTFHSSEDTSLFLLKNQRQIENKQTDKLYVHEFFKTQSILKREDSTWRRVRNIKGAPTPKKLFAKRFCHSKRPRFSAEKFFHFQTEK